VSNLSFSHWCRLLSSLVAPDKPGDKEYSDLVAKLSEHFIPAPSEIVKHFKFHTRFRKPGGSVTSYVSELRSIAKRCNFGGTLETMLRDRIVCGINDGVIQHRLLSEKELTFKTALEIAQEMKSAAKNVKELMNRPDGTVSPTPVHHVTEAAKPANICYRCGKPGHYAPKYKHKETVCSKCGKVGHLQKVCCSKRTGPPKATDTGSKSSTEQSGTKSKSVHTVVKSMNY